MEGIQTFKGSWPWPWPWIRPYGIPSCITHRPLPNTKFHSNRRNFLWTDGRTDGQTFPPLILIGRPRWRESHASWLASNTGQQAPLMGLSVGQWRLTYV